MWKRSNCSGLWHQGLFLFLLVAGIVAALLAAVAERLLGVLWIGLIAGGLPLGGGHGAALVVARAVLVVHICGWQGVLVVRLLQLLLRLLLVVVMVCLVVVHVVHAVCVVVTLGIGGCHL